MLHISLSGDQIAAAALADWRELSQRRHARFVIRVDLKLISDDAIYRDDTCTEHQVDWVPNGDVDLAPQNL